MKGILCCLLLSGAAAAYPQSQSAQPHAVQPDVVLPDPQPSGPRSPHTQGPGSIPQHTQGPGTTPPHAQRPDSTSPHAPLEHAIDSILRGSNALVGVAIRTPEGHTICRNDVALPMMSVFKFPLALAMLDHARRNAIPLSHPINIGPEWLDADTYSPLRDSLPTDGGTMALGELLRYCVSLSDNIACDLLLHLIGGPEAADSYIRSLNIQDIRIGATERDMHRIPGAEYLNTARPSAICALMHRFLTDSLPDSGHAALLRHLLEQTSTGSNKLKAGVPAGTQIGHKTGHSDRTPEGIQTAENDAGYVGLPDGRIYYITVFVTGSPDDDPTNEAIIAALSQAAYEYVTTKKAAR